MSSFTKPLDVRKVITKVPKKFLWVVSYKRTKQRWVTLREFRYYVGKENSNDYVDVPKGFETDFASIPRVLWSIAPPDGVYTQAAVLHDYLYQTGKYPRKKADRIFLEAMAVLGVALWKRRVIYRAVRLFGWMFFEQEKRRKGRARCGKDFL